MSKKGWLARFAAGTAMLLATLAAQAYTETSKGYNMPVGVSEVSREVYGLHMMIFWVCVVIGIVVFGAMIWSIIFHRRSKNPKPADFHESTTVEIIWTTIPFVILIAIAIPAAGTLIKMEDARNADMTIKVTGYQWKWEYEYLGEDVRFFSTLSADSNAARQLKSGTDVTKVPNYLVDVDKPLVIPVGKKVRFLITSNDVIHAWWVPELAVKKDAIPGYVNETWTRIDQEGVYRGVCAELCGRDHGFMPIVVKAVSEAEYAAFIASQKGGEPATEATTSAVSTTPDVVLGAASGQTEGGLIKVAAAAPADKAAQMKTGETVYKANCQACHQPNGKGLPPSFPSLVGSAVVKGPDAAQITQLIKGKNLMPPFKHLSDTDLAAVITYTRNSWGNSGNAVQPAAVTAAR